MASPYIARFVSKPTRVLFLAWPLNYPENGVGSDTFQGTQLDSQLKPAMRENANCSPVRQRKKSFFNEKIYQSCGNSSVCLEFFLLCFSGT